MNNDFDMPEILADPKKREALTVAIVKRNRKNGFFKCLCLISTLFSVILLMFLLFALFGLGIKKLSWTFLSSPPHPNPELSGFYPSMMGSIWLLILVPIFALPVGVATAIILEEFSPRNFLLKNLHKFIQLNITNLAGVPSVVYGIIGITLFVSMFGFFGQTNNPRFEFGVKYFDQFYNEADYVILVPVKNAGAPETVPVQGMDALDSSGQNIKLNVIGVDDKWPDDKEIALRTLRNFDTPGRISKRTWYYFRLPLGRGVITGALTLALVILPMIIISTQEALRAVPYTLREGGWGMGLTPWQTVRYVVLPSAIPTIMTGTILAISRAIGEAAPLLMIAGIVFISNPPGNLIDDFTAMPLQIYNWAQRPQKEFHDLAATGIIVLLIILLCFNAIAIIIRNKYQNQLDK